MSTVNEIEDLFPDYFQEKLSAEEKQLVDQWRSESSENEKNFQVAALAWNSFAKLEEMEQFNSFDALRKVQSRLLGEKKMPWYVHLQRIAAILIIPVLAYSAYVSFDNRKLSDQQAAQETVWQTVATRRGMVSHFILPDSTNVWLNSGSTLEYPSVFSSKEREVRLTGEAYFDVTHNEHLPFVIKSNKVDVKVLGTKLNVSNYEENISEVVLVSGKVRMVLNAGEDSEQVFDVKPGEKAVYNDEKNKLWVKNVDVDKYTNWRKGILYFDDEPLPKVIDRLIQWYNVDIVVADKEINNYIYKVTITGETLPQLLDLLCISAPITYKMEPAKELPSGDYSRPKVYLKKKVKKAKG